MRKTENIAPISTRFIHDIKEKIAPFLLRIPLIVQFTFAPSEVGKSNANANAIKLQDVFVEIIEALLRKVFAAQSGRCLQFK